MRTLFFSLVLLQMTLLFQFDLPAADQPIRGQIPPEGTWVRYEVSFIDGSDKAVLGTHKWDVILKVLGSEMRDGQRCRWFELEVNPTDQRGRPLAGVFAAFEIIIYKVLVSESGIQAPDKEVNVFAVMGRKDDEEPEVIDVSLFKEEYRIYHRGTCLFLQAIGMMDDLLINGSHQPRELATQLVKFSSVRELLVSEVRDRDGIRDNEVSDAEIVEHLSGTNPPGPSLRIISREAMEIRTPGGLKDGYKVQAIVSFLLLDFEVAPEFPIGLNAMTLRPGLVVPDENEDPWFSLKAIDHGNNAVTALPDVP